MRAFCCQVPRDHAQLRHQCRPGMVLAVLDAGLDACQVHGAASLLDDVSYRISHRISHAGMVLPAVMRRSTS
eukprot:2611262-Rhodomonas_salina.2